MIRNQVSWSSQIQIVSAIPKLKFATIPDNQRLESWIHFYHKVIVFKSARNLSIVPAKASRENRQLALLSRQQRLESTFLDIIIYIIIIIIIIIILNVF